MRPPLSHRAEEPERSGTDEGTEPADPGLRRILLLEGFLLFGLAPFLLWAVRWIGGHIPVIPVILLVGLGSLAFLRRRAPEKVERWFSAPWPTREVVRVGLQLFVAALLLTLYVQSYEPSSFLALPRRNPWIWGLIVCTYPFLSVLPQELFFRGLFFHRYGRLFPTTQLRVLGSAAAFGFAHLLYGNATAVLLSAVGGGLFAWTFVRTRSLLLVTAEHALYGVLLFTVGLGQYFFSAGVTVL